MSAPRDTTSSGRAVSGTAVAVLTLCGVAIFVTAGLHGLVGGGQLLAELTQQGVSADLRGGLAIGWALGSLCWATLGWIVVLAALRLRRGDDSLRLPAAAIGLVFLGFGLAALVLRGLKPHFLIFVVLGGLVLAALGAARADRRASSPS